MRYLSLFCNDLNNLSFIVFHLTYSPPKWWKFCYMFPYWNCAIYYWCGLECWPVLPYMLFQHTSKRGENFDTCFVTRTVLCITAMPRMLIFFFPILKQTLYISLPIERHCVISFNISCTWDIMIDKQLYHWTDKPVLSLYT